MSNNPLVSVSIPTYNSGKFLKLCLDALLKQSYKNIEINIIDGGSTDNTLSVAKKYGIKILKDYDSLLSARIKGVIGSKGKYVLLLDSDQIIDKDTISRAIKCLIENKLNMLILGEGVYSDKTVIEKLFKLDKKFVHAIKDINPYTSVLLPRFFDRSFLLKVFKNIDKVAIKKARPQDHAIIYLE